MCPSAIVQSNANANAIAIARIYSTAARLQTRERASKWSRRVRLLSRGSRSSSSFVSEVLQARSDSINKIIIFEYMQIDEKTLSSSKFI